MAFLTFQHCNCVCRAPLFETAPESRRTMFLKSVLGISFLNCIAATMFAVLQASACGRDPPYATGAGEGTAGPVVHGPTPNSAAIVAEEAVGKGGGAPAHTTVQAVPCPFNFSKCEASALRGLWRQRAMDTPLSPSTAVVASQAGRLRVNPQKE